MIRTSPTRIQLSIQDVLAGYDAVSKLYPLIPPMSIWRAWEYAAYQRYTLDEPVLDVGCGDGRFLKLLWPNLKSVVGIDEDPRIAAMARESGVYREVVATSADLMEFPLSAFASVFANCSIEHMNNLEIVLSKIQRSLAAGGRFLLSVVTEKFLEWATLPAIAALIDGSERGLALRRDYQTYHHLVNPLSTQQWINCVDEVGLEVIEYTPIVPVMTSRLFLFLDHLWHVPWHQTEFGDAIHPYLRTIPQFVDALRKVLDGVLKMERDWSECSGLVILAKKRS